MATMINTNTGILGMIDDLVSFPINQSNDNREMTLSGTYQGNDVEGALYKNGILKLNIDLGNTVLNISSNYAYGVIFEVKLDSDYNACPNFAWEQDKGVMEIDSHGKFVACVPGASQLFVDAAEQATKIAREFIEA